MFFLLIISTLNFNKKRSLFDFEIVIFEFVSHKLSILRYRKKRTLFLILLIFNMLFLRFYILIITFLMIYFIIKTNLI